MEGLVSQRTMVAVLGIFDLVMAVWLISEVSDFSLVASVWLVGLATWGVVWRLTRPRRPAKQAAPQSTNQSAKRPQGRR
jgi:hypothetical protein